MSILEQELKQEFERELRESKLPKGNRLYGYTVAAVMLGTWPTDAFVIPEHLTYFSVLRIFFLAFMALWWWLQDRWVVYAPIVLQIATGLSIVVMAVRLESVQNTYAQSILLILIAFPAIVPLPTRHVATSNSIIMIVFLVLPAVFEFSHGLTVYYDQCTLMLAAGIGSIFVARLLTRMRFDDFQQRKQLAKLDEAKSRFTANVHHEIRTPLTLMLAPLETMRFGDNKNLREDQQRYLEVIYGNALRLYGLINNLLDMARIEKQSAELHRQRIDLVDVIRGLCLGAQSLADKKEVELKIIAEAPALVHADPEAINKIFLNLISNALKFTDNGGAIEIEVKMVKGQAQVSVSDTGIGLAANQLERIFERFSQADGSESREFEGTGIGLALARELVELHGGKIRAESEGAGRGTTFFVELPLGEADASAAEDVLMDTSGAALSMAQSLAAMESNVVRQFEDAATEEIAQQTPTEGEFKDEVILLVEDNTDMRHLLTHLLSQRFRVVSAKNGEEGLHYLRHCKQLPTAVLSDVMMPQMSGTALTKAIKEDPNLASVPVVLLSARVDRERRVAGIEAGAEDFLAKPFHPQELLARMSSIVRSEKRNRERRQHADFFARLARRLQGSLRVTDVAESLQAELSNIAENVECHVVDDTHTVPEAMKAGSGVYDLGDRAGLLLVEENGARVVVTLGSEQLAENRELLEAVVAQGEVALRNAHLFEEVEYLATHDGLTSLLNRRHFFELAKLELERAHRKGTSVPVIMLDLDHFKKVNDTYGHAIGDEVLRTVSAQLNKTFRNVDLTCRYGGEEFSVVLADVESASAAEEIAERARRDIEALRIDTPAGPLRVTASIGIRVAGANGERLEDLLDQADQALYKAKADGRNRVVTF